MHNGVLFRYTEKNYAIKGKCMQLEIIILSEINSKDLFSLALGFLVLYRHIISKYKIYIPLCIYIYEGRSKIVWKQGG